MIVFMACESRSLLEGIANGVFGASNRVLYFAGRFLRGAFCLCLRVAGHLADGLFDGPFHLMSRTLYPILVHIRSPKLPIINTRFGALVAKAAAGRPFYAVRNPFGAAICQKIGRQLILR
jgi:hypothetical protein